MAGLHFWCGKSSGAGAYCGDAGGAGDDELGWFELGVEPGVEVGIELGPPVKPGLLPGCVPAPCPIIPVLPETVLMSSMGS